METTYELLGRARDPSEPPEGPIWYHLYLEQRDGDDRTVGTIQVPETRLPERGRYTLATHEVVLTFSEVHPSRESALGEDRATVVATFQSQGERWFRIDEPPHVDYGLISLERLHEPSKRGGLPDWLLEESTDGYVTIDVKYDEDATLERTRLDRAAIEERRG